MCYLIGKGISYGLDKTLRHKRINLQFNQVWNQKIPFLT